MKPRMPKPKPKVKVRAKPTYRQSEAHRATSQRMKGKATMDKFNSESMDSIRSRGSVKGSDVYMPDAGIDKKTGRGTMYTAGQYAKVRDFDARASKASRATFTKGAIVGGTIAGGSVAAGSYWTQKKREQKGQ